jgi:hypothetical protein
MLAILFFCNGCHEHIHYLYFKELSITWATFHLHAPCCVRLNDGRGHQLRIHQGYHLLHHLNDQRFALPPLTSWTLLHFSTLAYIHPPLETTLILSKVCSISNHLHSSSFSYLILLLIFLRGLQIA